MRAGIIGLGRIGFEFGLEAGRVQPASHFHCYQKLGAEIAVCDIDKEKRWSAIGSADGINGYSDVQFMLDDFNPEIVSISSPTNTHAEVALAAANCKSVKTIFLEKPIAQSLKEADEIIYACNEHGIHLAVNYSRRWSTVYRNLKSQIMPEMSVDLVGVHPGPLVRTGSHMLDLFNFLAFDTLKKQKFEDTTVQAFGTPNFAEYMQETEDFNINGYINYGSSSATLIGNITTPQDTVLFEIDALTKEKRIRITENGGRTEIYENRASKRYAFLNEYTRTFLSENEEENLLLAAIQDLAVIQELTSIGAMISCTGLDGRRALQIALGLHYSATHGNKPLNLSSVPYDYSVGSY